MTINYFNIFNATVIFDDKFEWNFGECSTVSIQRAVAAVMFNHNFKHALITDAETGECIMSIKNVRLEDLQKMHIDPDEYL